MIRRYLLHAEFLYALIFRFHLKRFGWSDDPRFKANMLVSMHLGLYFFSAYMWLVDLFSLIDVDIYSLLIQYIWLMLFFILTPVFLHLHFRGKNRYQRLEKDNDHSRSEVVRYYLYLLTSLSYPLYQIVQIAIA